MRANEFLSESATSIVYHYTSTNSAARVFKDGEFRLSSTSGNRSEEQYAPKGYPYFLSTTRSKVGDYHRYAGSSAVMFVLDGNWLTQRYPVKPIDYWDRSWIHSPDRTRESEDRVFSKSPGIPIDPITEVHVLLKDQSDFRSPLTRYIMIESKKRGIPTYLYIDENDWRLQNKRKAVSVSAAANVLKGQQQSNRFQRPTRGVNGYGRSSILNWIELIKKQPGQPLSKDADKLRYNLQYYGDMGNQLANDLANARKPDSNEYALAVKVNAYLNKAGVQLKDLPGLIKKKWAPAPRTTQ